MSKKQQPTTPETETTKSFETFDQFALSAFADRFERALLAESPFADGSLIVSLNGKFGTGKTCFLEMFKNRLEEKSKREVIYVNAWKNDFFNEPVVAIASEILAHIERQATVSDDLKRTLKSAFYTVIGTAASLTNQIINQVTGIDAIRTCRQVEEDQEKRNKIVGSVYYKEYTEKKALFDKLNEALASYLKETKKKPLFILIDELDRARPDYAVKFLETLKHFFTMQNVIFVLGIDREQLASSIKALYGADMNVSEYLRKFIHKDVPLPTLPARAIKNYIDASLNKFFNSDAETNRFYAINLKKGDLDELANLCFGYGITLRQMNEILRTLSYYFLSVTDRTMLFGWTFTAMFYAIIRVAFPNFRTEICAGTYSFSSMLDALESRFRLTDKHTFDFFAHYLFLITLTNENKNQNEFIFLKRVRDFAGTSEDPEYEIQRRSIYENVHLILGRGALDREKSILQYIAQKIEDCMTCFEEQTL